MTNNGNKTGDLPIVEKINPDMDRTAGEALRKYVNTDNILTEIIGKISEMTRKFKYLSIENSHSI